MRYNEQVKQKHIKERKSITRPQEPGVLAAGCQEVGGGRRLRQLGWGTCGLVPVLALRLWVS